MIKYISLLFIIIQQYYCHINTYNVSRFDNNTFIYQNDNIINIQERGVIPDQTNIETCNQNTKIMNQILAGVQKQQTIYVPNATYWFNGGIFGSNLRQVTFQIDGTIAFQNNQIEWPRQENGNVLECIHFDNIEDITFTSSGTGTLNGNGAAWWGYISYLEIQENRPRLMLITDSARMLIENLLFLDSPYWTFYANDVIDLEIRYSQIYVNVNNGTTHDLQELGAFNTDGFDVAGKNIWIHDVTVWNDDDCVCVKQLTGANKRAQCAENMLFENIVASGVGLTVGSIGPSDEHTCVKNITFRNIEMPNTFKGIYMKSRPGHEGQTGEITDVLYENITMTTPTQWPIWIGPQQASYKDQCSLLWPQLAPLAKCPVTPYMTWNNIYLKDVFIKNPSYSPGVILGNSDNPMENITFDNVIVENPGTKPFKKGYKCQGVKNSKAIGKTNPVPSCFDDETNN